MYNALASQYNYEYIMGFNTKHFKHLQNKTNKKLNKVVYTEQN